MRLRNRIDRVEKRLLPDVTEATRNALANLLDHPAVAADGAGPLDRVSAIVEILDFEHQYESYRRRTLSVDEFKVLPLAERLRYLELSLAGRPADLFAATEAIRQRIVKVLEETVAK